MQKATEAPTVELCFNLSAGFRRLINVSSDTTPASTCARRCQKIFSKSSYFSDFAGGFRDGVMLEMVPSNHDFVCLESAGKHRDNTSSQYENEWHCSSLRSRQYANPAGSFGRLCEEEVLLRFLGGIIYQSNKAAYTSNIVSKAV